MTIEEIKQTYTMRDIVDNYGISVNRAGFCRCPFHGNGNERTPSMKIYEDSFYCFACNQKGDIFAFIQEYEGITFREAFVKLGGEYKYTSKEERKALQEKWKRQKEERERKKAEDLSFKNMLRDAITLTQSIEAEPYSDDWCLLKNANPKLVYWWDCLLDGEELDREDVSKAIENLYKSLKEIKK